MGLEDRAKTPDSISILSRRPRPALLQQSEHHLRKRVFAVAGPQRKSPHTFGRFTLSDPVPPVLLPRIEHPRRTGREHRVPVGVHLVEIGRLEGDPLARVVALALPPPDPELRIEEVDDPFVSPLVLDDDVRPEGPGVRLPDAATGAPAEPPVVEDADVLPADGVLVLDDGFLGRRGGTGGARGRTEHPLRPLDDLEVAPELVKIRDFLELEEGRGSFPVEREVGRSPETDPVPEDLPVPPAFPENRGGDGEPVGLADLPPEGVTADPIEDGRAALRFPDEADPERPASAPPQLLGGGHDPEAPVEEAPDEAILGRIDIGAHPALHHGVGDVPPEPSGQCRQRSPELGGIDSAPGPMKRRREERRRALGADPAHCLEGHVVDIPSPPPVRLPEHGPEGGKEACAPGGAPGENVPEVNEGVVVDPRRGGGRHPEGQEGALAGAVGEGRRDLHEFPEHPVEGLLAPLPRRDLHPAEVGQIDPPDGVPEAQEERSGPQALGVGRERGGHLVQHSAFPPQKPLPLGREAKLAVPRFGTEAPPSGTQLPGDLGRRSGGVFHWHPISGDGARPAHSMNAAKPLCRSRRSMRSTFA